MVILEPTVLVNGERRSGTSSGSDYQDHSNDVHNLGGWEIVRGVVQTGHFSVFQFTQSCEGGRVLVRAIPEVQENGGDISNVDADVDIDCVKNVYHQRGTTSATATITKTATTTRKYGDADVDVFVLHLDGKFCSVSEEFILQHHVASSQSMGADTISLDIQQPQTQYQYQPQRNKRQQQQKMRQKQGICIAVFGHGERQMNPPLEPPAPPISFLLSATCQQQTTTTTTTTNAKAEEVSDTAKWLPVDEVLPLTVDGSLSAAATASHASPLVLRDLTNSHSHSHSHWYSPTHDAYVVSNSGEDGVLSFLGGIGKFILAILEIMA